MFLDLQRPSTAGGPQLNGSVLFNTSKKGRPHFVDLEMNLLSEASRPVRR